jgi:hypothetical protein
MRTVLHLVVLAIGDPLSERYQNSPHAARGQDFAQREAVGTGLEPVARDPIAFPCRVARPYHPLVSSSRNCHSAWTAPRKATPGPMS